MEKLEHHGKKGKKDKQGGGNVEQFYVVKNPKSKEEEEKKIPVENTASSPSAGEGSHSKGGKHKKQSKFDKLHEKVDSEIKDEWEKEQYALREQLIEEDSFAFSLANPLPAGKEPLRLVGALDISYSKYNDKKACAALVVLDYSNLVVVYEDYELDTVDFPYIPGFLAFKEVPLYTRLIERLRSSQPDLVPQIVLVDGNGIMHTRSFGSACHIGVVTNIPTIGVSKSVFAVDGLTQRNVKELCDENLLDGGDTVDLIGNSGKAWGTALRTTRDSKNPVFVSRGHRVGHDTSVQVVKGCVKKYRIPEPIRQADLNSRHYVRIYYDEKGE